MALKSKLPFLLSAFLSYHSYVLLNQLIYHGRDIQFLFAVETELMDGHKDIVPL